MKTNGLLLLLLTLAIGPALAQDKADVPYAHSFGLGAGTTTGIGLSYRYWPGPLGYQVTGLFQVSPTGLGQYYNLGATGLWALQDLPWTKFYTYLGGSGRYSRPSWGGVDYGAGFGAGLGFEFIAFDHIALNLMAGYGITTGNRSGFNTVLSVESGLYYRMQP